MFKNLKKSLYIILIITVSCRSQNNTNTNLVVNSNVNEVYKKTRKAFSGKLNEKEYDDLKLLIENELNEKIPVGKSILINYSQKASNCILKKFSTDVISNVTQNVIDISSRICNENNATGFFVFSEESFFKDFYLVKKQFRLDSGFFYNNIFTLHENCEAFFIVKPDGKFFKYYGEDYFSEVEKYLKE